MILTFADRTTKDIFHGLNSKDARKFPQQLHVLARRKLYILHYITQLPQLAIPPGNNLEALKGTLSGFHSIRINQQWRIIFRWNGKDAEDVQIVDYH